MSEPTPSPVITSDDFFTVPIQIPRVHIGGYIVKIDDIVSFKEKLITMLRAFNILYFLGDSHINAAHYSVDGFFEFDITLYLVKDDDKETLYVLFENRLGDYGFSCTTQFYASIRDNVQKELFSEFPLPLGLYAILPTLTNQEDLYFSYIRDLKDRKSRYMLGNLESILKNTNSLLSDMITYMPLVTEITNFKPANSIEDVLWTKILSIFAKENPVLIKSLLSASQIDNLVLSLADGDKDMRALSHTDTLYKYYLETGKKGFGYDFMGNIYLRSKYKAKFSADILNCIVALD